MSNNRTLDEQLHSIASIESKGRKPQSFIVRASTGKAAEEYFQRQFSEFND